MRGGLLPVVVVAAFVIGAALVAAGTALAYLPAGLIVAGIEVATAAYVGAYSQARRRR